MADQNQKSGAPAPVKGPQAGAPVVGAPVMTPRAGVSVSQQALDAARAAAAQVADKVTGAGAQGRAVMISLPDGSTIRRTDYIKARWADGANRGQIVKELKALNHECSYQIVFAATKDKPQGQAQTAAPATATPAA